MIIKNNSIGRSLQYTKAKIQGQRTTTNTQDAVIDILRKSQHNAPNTYGFDMSNYPSNRLANCPIKCFVVYANGEPAGFVDVYGGKPSSGGHSGVELFMVVAPQYYGHHIGRSLLDMTVDWLNGQDEYDCIAFPILADVTPLKKLLDSSQFKLDRTDKRRNDGETWIVYKYIK